MRPAFFSSRSTRQTHQRIEHDAHARRLSCP
jgi:hypothetical protein